MNNKLIYTEGSAYYKWNRYTKTETELEYQTLGTSVSYADSITVTKVNDRVQLALSGTTTTKNVLQSTVASASVTRAANTRSLSFDFGSDTIRYSAWSTYFLHITYNSGLGCCLPTMPNGTTLAITSSTSGLLGTIKGKFIYYVNNKCVGKLFYVPTSAGLTKLSTYWLLTGVYEMTMSDYTTVLTHDISRYEDTGYLLSGGTESEDYSGIWYGVAVDNGGIKSSEIIGKYWTTGNKFYYTTSSGILRLSTPDSTWKLSNTSLETLGSAEELLSESDIYPHNQFVTPYYYEFLSSPATEAALTDADIYGGVTYKQVVNTTDGIEVGATAGASISFDVVTNDILTIGKKIIYQVKQANDSAYRNVGEFYVTSIDKGETRYTITAYDGISKFDVVIDEWLDNLIFPMTARDMLTSLCSYCGVKTDSSTFINSTMSLLDNFESTNLTGRYVLSYIALLGAGFARMSPVGVLQIQTLGFETSTLDNSKYTKLLQQDYSCQPIDKVRVAYDLESEGVEAGTGSNILSIYGNPLLYFDTASEIQTNVTNIYNQLYANSTYTPMKIELLEDFSINAGSLVRIGSASTYIFSKSWDSSGVKFESTGNKLRAATNVNKNSEINALRGKVHKLNVDVSGILSEVIDSTTGEYKVLTWDANQGLIVCNNVTGNTVSITGDNISTGAITADKILAGVITFDKLNSSVQTLINEGAVWRQGTVPTGTTEKPLVAGALWYCTADIGTTYYEDTWYSYDGSTWKQTSNPYYIQSTYIDSAEVRSPSIVGNNISVNADYGGGFNVKKAGVAVGHVGIGRYGSSGTDYGVLIANDTNGDSYVDPTEDNFVICLPNEILINAGETFIQINKDGEVYVNSTGTGGVSVPLGYARFG